jgi:hypothetical protein
LCSGERSPGMSFASAALRKAIEGLLDKRIVEAVAVR